MTDNTDKTDTTDKTEPKSACNGCSESPETMVDYRKLSEGRVQLCWECFCPGCCPVLTKHGLNIECLPEISDELQISLANFVISQLETPEGIEFAQGPGIQAE